MIYELAQLNEKVANKEMDNNYEADSDRYKFSLKFWGLQFPCLFFTKCLSIFKWALL